MPAAFLKRCDFGGPVFDFAARGLPPLGWLAVVAGSGRLGAAPAPMIARRMPAGLGAIVAAGFGADGASGLGAIRGAGFDRTRQAGLAPAG